MTKTQTETINRRNITDALRRSGWAVFYIFQGLGSYKGISDLIALKDGKTIFIEVKTPTGRQSEHQKKFEKICIEHGCRYILARSVNDVAELLNYKALF